MIDITKSYPAQVNQGLLYEQLLTSFPMVTMRQDHCVIHAVLPEDDTTIDSIIGAHDHTGQSIEQEQGETQRITKDGIKKLLATELVKGSPDTAAVYAALQTLISGSAPMVNAHQNTANLFGFDTGTQAGYLRAAYLSIALMS